MADRVMAELLYITDKNKTWAELVQKQKENDIYLAIIASAQRSRTSVNKSLGLE